MIEPGLIGFQAGIYHLRMPKVSFGRWKHWASSHIYDPRVIIDELPFNLLSQFDSSEIARDP